MMIEAWLAFIILCNGQECAGTKTYEKKASYSETICLKEAYGWAIQMYALTKKTYGYGCEKINYIPPKVN